MSANPEDSIAEILGQPAHSGFDPAKSGYRCPFIGSACTKRSTASEHPYPICTIRKRDSSPVCVCPKRFYAIDFLDEVIEHAWPGIKPEHPRIAREVQMKDFGNVDFVIADTPDGQEIKQFLSVELQAIDITGTVRDAYNAIISGDRLEKKKSYGLNWKNVYKRYIHQIISKGYYHHHWGTKIVAVIQDEVYDYICRDADFFRTASRSDFASPQVNIIFMSYQFIDDGNGGYDLALDKVEGTSHSNLQQAVLYKSAPSRDDFCQKIAAALNR
ncbi:hypothetical protein [Minwuia sp.]|uniref:hypothetical protein n=1 Tax=Minwuia sp. TaxID=2493630 RepID=UPI003A8E212C